MVLQWLEKANWTTDQITAPTGGGLLTTQQAQKFIQVAIDASVIVKQANNFTSNAPKFEVPRIKLATRILTVGAESTRVADTDRKRPTTGLVTLSTVLFRGEIPVSDELFEDNIERASVADRLMQMIGEAVGRDIEEIAIKADTTRIGSETQILAQQDGIIALMQDDLPSGQKIDAAAFQTYDELFAKAIEALPSNYRGNYDQMRFYVPVAVADGYIGALAARGTALGDNATLNRQSVLKYRGIQIEEVPVLSGNGDPINGTATDYGKFVMLMHPKNVYVGWHRRVRIEKFRDPREGTTSFLPNLRFDVKIADPEYGVLVSNVTPANLF